LISRDLAPAGCPYGVPTACPPHRPAPRAVKQAPAATKPSARLPGKLAGLAEWASGLSHVPKPVPARLGIVLAAWDPLPSTAALQALQSRASRLSLLECSLVVVANRPSIIRPLKDVADPDVLLVSGSNNETEFSAYDEGRQALLTYSGSHPDVWLIANDRFAAYGQRHLKFLNHSLLKFTAASLLASGDVDTVPRQFWKLDANLVPQLESRAPQSAQSSYIRSNWLLISDRALRRLGPLTTITSVQYAEHVPNNLPGLPAGSPEARWPLSTWLGNAIGNWMYEWLTQAGNWHKAEPLTPSSWPRLRRKALAILNEQLLTVRLREAGIAIVPWRQARALSSLDPTSLLAHDVLDAYRLPGTAHALATCNSSRFVLAAASMAARVHFERLALKLWQTSLARASLEAV
jgi:hypothetical protein